MEFRRLDTRDIKELTAIVNAKSNVADVIPDQLGEVGQYRTRWIEGMIRYYLVTNDTHYLYGAFNGNELISCMSWRCDLPDPWNDGWVVGNLKAKPGYSIRTNGIVEMWKIMFEICESKGLKRWHMVIPYKNQNKYQAVADRYFRDVDQSYLYHWSMIIPPNTQPEVDWVWGTMGRILLNSEIRVRTGIKKCVKI